MTLPMLTMKICSDKQQLKLLASSMQEKEQLYLRQHASDVCLHLKSVIYLIYIEHNSN